MVKSHFKNKKEAKTMKIIIDMNCKTSKITFSENAIHYGSELKALTH